jgi:voltage-gated sodium channel
MNKISKAIAYSENFQTFILFLIILTAISMGVETVPYMADEYGDIFLYLHYFVQVVFAFEIVIRLLAYAPKYKTFFKDKWNVFDFIIIAASFLPVIGSFALIARLLRLLRVMRLMSVSDRLRGFMDRLKESLDEISYAAASVSIFSYIYIIAGHYLFFEISPENWGTLKNATLSVFYLMLLQDVRGIVEPLVTFNFINLLFFVMFYITFAGLFLAVFSAGIIQVIRGRND